MAFNRSSESTAASASDAAGSSPVEAVSITTTVLTDVMAGADARSPSSEACESATRTTASECSTTWWICAGVLEG